MGWVTYIIELEDDFWYVGRTTDTHRRLKQHFTGRGAKWLKLHPPKKLKEVWAGDCERSKTLALMREHGVERVRGGPWCGTRSTPVVCELLLKQMATQQLADISIADWQVLPSQRNQYGALSWPIAVNKDSKAPPRIQLGSDGMTLRCPFGVSSYAGAETGGRQNLDFSVPAWLTDLRSFLQSVDKFVLDYVWEHRAEFFVKKPPSNREVLEGMYHSLMSVGKPEYDPLLRTKVSQSTPVFICTDDGNPAKKGSIADVTPGATCVPIVTISKIWVMGANQFGVTAVTQALLLWPKSEKGIEDLGFETAHAMPRSQSDVVEGNPL